MRATKFLKIYHDLAKSLAHPDDLEELYYDLKFTFDDDEKVGKWFQKSSPTNLDKGIAIDAVAHAIHTEVKEGDGTFLHKAFPGASVETFRTSLDQFAGMEKESEVRKVNRGYYTPLLATEGLIFLAKEQVGKSSKNDIKDAIEEYERLFTAGVGSPAELLTLYRYYGPKSKYAQAVKEQGLNLDENEPLVVGGPASVEGIDHENHLITTEALDVAFDAFMKNFRTRNCMVFHCLTPDTKVFAPNRGYIPIEQIKEGQKVLTHEGRYRKVLEVITHHSTGKIMHISLENGEVIKITDEHPVLTRDRGWVKAGELILDDVLMTADFPGTKKGNQVASQNKKGKTWEEAYRHSRPQYQNQFGENNSNWRGGASFGEYSPEFNFKLKETIRQFDNYICQLCGKTEEQEQLDYNRRLSIHHIDYDKQNCREDNLITTCCVCNSKANSNQEYYIELCKGKINDRQYAIIHNGTKILNIDESFYDGIVYNLEVEEDHSYVGKGLIYHNSDVQTGWALPAYITKTGKVFKSGVDQNGFFLVSELRSDTRVAKRLVEEVIDGNILSYSIAGSATDIEIVTKGVQRFMQVNALELAEITYCVLPDTKIWTTTDTNKGEVPSLKIISRLQEGNKVLTHNMQFKTITKVLKREVKKEQIYVLINAHGKELHVTGEHPILILDMLEGEKWVPANEVTVGQTVKIMNDQKDFSSSEIVEIKKPKKKYNGTVYNLEVEDDNSYLTAAMAVHNCTPAGTEIWTKEGLKNIEDIQENDIVFTHENRWKPVVYTMQREISDDLVQLTTEKGDILQITSNHPVRTLVYGGEQKGTRYQWVPAGEIKENDLVSAHFPVEGLNCLYCNAPLFTGKYWNQKTKYCDNICRFKAPGNRKGSTKENGDPWAIELSQRRNIQYQDAEFCKTHFEMLHANRKKMSKWQINKAETKIFNILEELFPNEWKFVGNGEVVIGGRNPDFINTNGQKKLIEFYGDYWHQGQDGLDRIKHFKEYGFETLIIWENEFKNDFNEVKNRICEFSNNKLVKITKVERIPFNGTVYNFEVEEDHSYTTKAMVIKNCEKGVNQGAHFNILKSQTSHPSFADLPGILPVVTLDIYQDGNEIIIKADQENSITDQAYLDLRKSIPSTVNIRVSDLVSDDAVLLNKEYETNWYNNIVRNYPEFNNTGFSNYVQDKSGYAPKDFKKISRPDMDRIAVDYQKDDLAIRPEFSSAYVQKESNAYDAYPDFANMVEGNIFQKMKKGMKERYTAVNYKNSTVEGKECHTCIFFSEGYCTKIHLPVKQEMTCNEYKPMPGAMEAEAWAERSGKPYEEVSKMSKMDEFKETSKLAEFKKVLRELE